MTRFLVAMCRLLNVVYLSVAHLSHIALRTVALSFNLAGMSEWKCQEHVKTVTYVRLIECCHFNKLMKPAMLHILCLQRAAQTEICSHLVRWDSRTDAFTPWLLVVTQPHTHADTRAPSNSQTRFTLVLRGSVIYLKGCQWALVVTDSDLAQSYAASLKAPHLESNFKGSLHACSF